MNNAERRRIWDSLKADIEAGAINLGSTETARNPLWAEFVHQQRAYNAAFSAQMEAMADQYLRTGHGRNPSGVDNQGDAQVVETVTVFKGRSCGPTEIMPRIIKEREDE